MLHRGKAGGRYVQDVVATWERRQIVDAGGVGLRWIGSASGGVASGYGCARDDGAGGVGYGAGDFSADVLPQGDRTHEEHNETA